MCVENDNARSAALEGADRQAALLTAVAEMAGVVLRLVVHPHVICDVGRRQELPADVAGDLLLVANHVCTQAVLGGKAGLAGLKDE